MPTRIALAILLALSLALSGGAWAHGPLPGNIDTVSESAIDAVGMAPADAPQDIDQGVGESGARQSASDCGHHADTAPSTPAVNDGADAPTKTAPTQPHGCCTDSGCQCAPPIGKGMAIGPAHLASHGTPAPYAPVSTPAMADPYQSLLRPPIP